VSRVSFDPVAVAYDDFMGRWTRALMPALLRAAEVAPGQRVLDVATGTGESALLLADAVGFGGAVLGADISLPMLRRASSKTGGRPIRLVAADGQALACRAEAFDRVVCQLGLHFFPDPVAGVREARRVLRPGGRFAALVWSAPERVPWYSVIAGELVAHFPARRGDLFAGARLADPARLEGVLREAGLRDVRVAVEAQSMTFASFEAYWSHVESGAIRMGLMLRELPAAAAAAIRERVRAALAVFAAGGGLAMPAEALVAVGRR
jgi:ubiquinone/menaquinone biosynthesis C-methylase UbiE